MLSQEDKEWLGGLFARATSLVRSRTGVALLDLKTVKEELDAQRAAIARLRSELAEVRRMMKQAGRDSQ